MPDKEGKKPICAFETSIMQATTPRELESIFNLIKRRTHEHSHEADAIVSAYERRAEQLKADVDRVVTLVRDTVYGDKVVP